MPVASIDPETIVRRVMDDHPATIAVFIARRMHCPGCAMAPFMTLAEAAASYGVGLDGLIADLEAAVASAAKGEES